MPRVLPGGTLLHRHARQAPVELLPQWSTVIQLSARHLSCPSHVSGTGNVVATRTGAGVLGVLPARSIHTLAATVTGKSCLSRSHRSPRTLDCLTRSLSNTTLSTNASIPSLYLSGLERQHRDRTKESSTSSLDSAKASLPEASASSWRFPTSAHSGQRWNQNTATPVQVWTSTSEALSQLHNSLGRIRLGGSGTSASALQTALFHYNYLSRLQSIYNIVLVPRRETRALFLLQGKEHKTRSNLEQLLRIAMDLIRLNEKDRQKNRQAAIATKAIPYAHNHADNYHGLRVSEYTILMNWIGSITAIPELDQRRTQLRRDVSKTSESLSHSVSSSPTSLLYEQGVQERQGSAVPAGSMDRVWGIWQDFLLTGMKPDVVLYTMLMDTLLKAKEYNRASQIWSHMQQHTEHDVKNGVQEPALKPEKAAASSEASDPVSKTLNIGTRSADITGVITSGKRERSSAIELLENHHQHASPSISPNTQTFSVLMQTHVLGRDLEGAAQTYQKLLQTADSRDAGPNSSHVPSPATIASPGSQQSDLHGRANTVLLNQILRLLVDLGEDNAAKEIYTVMKKSETESSSNSYSNTDQGLSRAGKETAVDERPLVYSIDAFILPRTDLPPQLTPVKPESTARTEEAETAEAPPSSASSSKAPMDQKPAMTQSSMPFHHRAFSRRSAWSRKARKSSATQGPSVRLVPCSIQPDETTLGLMLDMASRTKDHELEKAVLEDMYTLDIPIRSNDGK
ncbi:MAG: hypothetical protein J3Q66DRAFT_336656 [Benniella sp.]|nr:MAG: hypothetical protein J3Q66DRAFT_336656 [Benniella sp.]